MYSAKQREALETFYAKWDDRWLPHEERHQIQHLSDMIGLSKDQIRAWLRNRRARGGYKGKSHHTVEQVQVLEAIYIHHSKYPSRLFKTALAKEIGLTPTQVKIWFQCRRQRKAPRLLSQFPSSEAGNWKEIIARVNAAVHLEEDAELALASVRGGEAKMNLSSRVPGISGAGVGVGGFGGVGPHPGLSSSASTPTGFLPSSAAMSLSSLCGPSPSGSGVPPHSAFSSPPPHLALRGMPSSPASHSPVGGPPSSFPPPLLATFTQPPRPPSSPLNTSSQPPSSQPFPSKTKTEFTNGSLHPSSQDPLSRAPAAILPPQATSLLHPSQVPSPPPHHLAAGGGGSGGGASGGGGNGGFDLETTQIQLHQLLQSARQQLPVSQHSRAQDVVRRHLQQQLRQQQLLQQLQQQQLQQLQQQQLHQQLQQLQQQQLQQQQLQQQLQQLQQLDQISSLTQQPSTPSSSSTNTNTNTTTLILHQKEQPPTAPDKLEKKPQILPSLPTTTTSSSTSSSSTSSSSTSSPPPSASPSSSPTTTTTPIKMASLLNPPSSSTSPTPLPRLPPPGLEGFPSPTPSRLHPNSLPPLTSLSHEHTFPHFLPTRPPPSSLDTSLIKSLPPPPSPSSSSSSSPPPPPPTLTISASPSSSSSSPSSPPSRSPSPSSSPSLPSSPTPSPSPSLFPSPSQLTQLPLNDQLSQKGEEEKGGKEGTKV